MKDYSDFSKMYVQDICDVLNEVGAKMSTATSEKPFSLDNIVSKISKQ